MSGGAFAVLTGPVRFGVGYGYGYGYGNGIEGAGHAFGASLAVRYPFFDR